MSGIVSSSYYTAIWRDRESRSRSRRREKVARPKHYAEGGPPHRSLVVVDVQIALDTDTLAGVHVLHLVDVVLPQRCVGVGVIVGARGSLVDNLEERSRGGRGRGWRRKGGADDFQDLFHAVAQSVFQLLDDLEDMSLREDREA